MRLPQDWGFRRRPSRSASRWIRSLQVDADRDQLYRVFNNLCRNAAQAIENQGQKTG